MRITFMAASEWELEKTVLRLFARVKPDDVTREVPLPGTLGQSWSTTIWKRHFRHFWHHVAVKGHLNGDLSGSMFLLT
ncbi:hypothetical protein MRX96_044521 [Rhipicephalus microplus]